MEPLEEITLLKYYKDENGSFIFDENGYVLCDIIDSQETSFDSSEVECPSSSTQTSLSCPSAGYSSKSLALALNIPTSKYETPSTQTSTTRNSTRFSLISLAPALNASASGYKAPSIQTSTTCTSTGFPSKSSAPALNAATSGYKAPSTQTCTTRTSTGFLSRSLAPALHVPTSRYKAPSTQASTSQILTNHLSRIEWSDRETTLLLDLYIEWFPHIGPTKRFMYKRSMWAFIVESLKTILDFICNADQCENHFKTIIRMWSDTLKKKRASGGIPHDLPWREQYEKVIALDDSILPEVLVGIGRREYLKETSKEKKELNKNKKRAKIINGNKQPKNAEVKEIVQVIREISNTKEENKKRRWEEKKKILKVVYKDLQIDEDF